MELSAILVAVAVLLALLVIGVPVAVSLGVAGIVGLLMIKDFAIMSIIVRLHPFDVLSSFSLIAVPLFILMGHLAFHAGISSDAFRVARQWVGSLPGGLTCATVLGSGLFAATSGSSLATAGTIGRFAIDQMRQQRYDMRFAAATAASAGGLGILIPPSITLVIYGIITYESIGKLLMAGFLPGILSILVYIVAIILLSSLWPRLAPTSEGTPWKEKTLGLLSLWRIAILFLIVIGGIYSGIFTPTEASAAGAASTLVILMLTKRGNIWPALRDALLGAASTTAMIFFLLVGGVIFGFFVAMAGLPQTFASFVLGLNVPTVVALISILLLYIPLGMFLDITPLLVLTLPIVHPVVVALGYSGIWFGVIVIILCEMAFITPPVGMTVYVVSGIAPDIPVEQIFLFSSFYVALMIIVIALLILFPQIALFLPSILT